MIEIEAAAQTPGASVQWVKFFSNGQAVATVSSAPYVYTMEGVGAGEYVLSARVRDSLGRTANSDPVTVTVTNPAPPTTEQEIALGAGWNLISSYNAPADSSIAAVLADILDEVVIVQDEAGQVFLPQDDVDTIGFWRRGEAYQVYVTQPVTLTVEGPILEPEATPITMGQSQPWNQVAYLRTSPMAIEEALASISTQLVVAKDNAGRIYMPEMDIDQIGDLVPGQGYKMYVASEVSLVYPPNGGGLVGEGQSARASTPARASSSSLAHSSGHASLAKETATLIVVADSTLNDAFVEVANAGGEVVSTAAIRNGLAVLTIRGGDPALPGDQAVVPGEALTLSVRGVSGEGVDGAIFGEPRDFLQETVEEAPMTFTPDAVHVVGLRREAFSIDELSVHNYPNPFAIRSTLSYQLSRDQRVDVQIFDVTGRLVRTLVAEEQEAGYHEVSVEATGLASGTYYCRLRTGGESVVRPITLVR